MFYNLLSHLTTIVGIVVLIALAIIIVAFVGSFTYVVVKHFIDSAYKTCKKPEEENKDDN